MLNIPSILQLLYEKTMANSALTYTETVKTQTDTLKERLLAMGEVYPANDRIWQTLAAQIVEINRLKHEKNAVILVHNYMTPDIFFGVGDITGDSLKLAQEAAKTSADVIVQCGVHFMAETAKILCPTKTVLIPDLKAGCSLAESITAEALINFKAEHPGLPVVSYVNTSAEVKAHSDVCCTSSNAVQIVRAMSKRSGSKRIIMTPDKFLAQNVAKEVAADGIEIVIYDGACIVHEQYSAQDVKNIRARYPGIVVLAHPECPPEVLAEADYSGSTSQMDDWVKKNSPSSAALMTECSMGSNIAMANPHISIKSSACISCPHMQKITIPKILHALQTGQPEVTVPEDIRVLAKKPIDLMLELS